MFQSYFKESDMCQLNQVVPRCIRGKNKLTHHIYNVAIFYLLLLCFPSSSVGWSLPFLGSFFSDPKSLDVQSDNINVDTHVSHKPVIEKTNVHKPYVVNQASDKEISIPTGNSSLLIVGTLILGGLVIASVFLYALDVYATSQIDRYLYDYYGPELYDRYTNYYDPNQFDPYNMNGHYSATTAQQYYGLYRSSKGGDSDVAPRILQWIQNTMEVFDVGAEAFRNHHCREYLICEAYQTDFTSGILGSKYLTHILDNYPIFRRAKSASNNSKSRQEGCSPNYTGCSAMARVFQDAKRTHPNEI